ncbi:hypothetical protein GCM10023205_27430 [Yinghuangia aomiensis]|uniref:Uncharacterized protein n=1 Tax=Yinghuangia aomiensis TaxID=676205 RepID=A0ABP9H5C6_9ACTN
MRKRVASAARDRWHGPRVPHTSNAGCRLPLPPELPVPAAAFGINSRDDLPFGTAAATGLLHWRFTEPAARVCVSRIATPSYPAGEHAGNTTGSDFVVDGGLVTTL